MFTIYIDDSGSDPKQAVAVAAGLIVPAKQIPLLDNRWSSFKTTQKFTDLHASVCAAKNPKTDFAAWDDDKVRRVLNRACQITQKRLKSICVHNPQERF
jgi:hypothetical protein